MLESRKLFQVISTIERKHGLSTLDPSARELLDLIIAREIADQRSTASDLIAASTISRAAVYRKIKDLKDSGWIEEQWIDFKLCYVVSKKVDKLSKELRAALKTAS